MKILWIIICILLSGCAYYQVEVIKDDFKGYTIKRLNGNIIETGLVSTESLNSQLFQNKDTNIISLIFHYYSSAGWMFISSGNSLAFLIDDKPLLLNGEGSVNHRNVLNNGIEEYAYYDITKEQYFSIISAKVVKLKVYGDKGNLDYDPLNGKILSNLTRFYNEYLK